MARVKVSSNYRITIPRNVREVLHIRKGDMVSVIQVGGAIEVIPDHDIAEGEGISSDLSLSDIHEGSDWAKEAERRHEQFERGEVEMIPGEEVFEEIRRKYRKEGGE